METFYTVEAIAPQLNLSVQAVYAACRNHQIPHVRIGKRIRIPESSIRKWIEDQTSEYNDAQESENSYQAVN
jgi:excisionase family DNA binding protein